MKLRACCKINVGLDILRRREDGFHDLETVMIPVRGLYDEIELKPSEGCDVKFLSEGLVVDCAPESNLCVKAYRLLKSRYDIGGVDITLCKRVPFGAGLGGGSSDATTVLLGLNQLFELGLSDEELESMAAELGSDTPFFVRCVPQLCEGRGELMSRVDLPLKGLWLLLVKPEVGISTREAYAGVKPEVPATSLRERLSCAVEQWQGSVKNDFESSIFPKYPILSDIKECMLQSGAVYAAMSGSGSTMFGLYRHKPDVPKEFGGLFTHLEQL